MLRETLIVLDFETTGLSPHQGDRITEVAAVRLEGEKIVDRFESLVNCGVQVLRKLMSTPVAAATRELTRITREATNTRG